MRSPARPALADFPKRHPWWTLIGVLGIGLVVLVLLWDWNWFKRPIERRVSAQTGRSFHIDGNLDVDLGRTLTIRADGLRFGNAPWAREREMGTLQRLEFDLRFWPLLRGDVRIPRIALDTPVVHFQRNDKCQGNWVFGDGDSGELPEFGTVHIENGTLTFFEPAERTDIKVAVDSKQRRRQDAEPPIALEGGGKWNGNAFNLKGTAESPIELRNSERPYRIDVRAAAGPTDARSTCWTRTSGITGANSSASTSTTCSTRSTTSACTPRTCAATSPPGASRTGCSAGARTGA